MLDRQKQHQKHQQDVANARKLRRPEPKFDIKNDDFSYKKPSNVTSIEYLHHNPENPETPLTATYTSQQEKAKGSKQSKSKLNLNSNSHYTYIIYLIMFTFPIMEFFLNFYSLLIDSKFTHFL